MIVVYGKPLSFKSVYTNSSFTWKKCIEFCWKEPQCVLAYNSGANKCQWFPHENITSVQQTNKTQGFIVAFKINATSSKCLSGVNPPTFGNKPITGSATVYLWDIFAANRYNYTISLASGVWKFSLTVKRACQTSQYALSRRPNNSDYCLKLPVYSGKIPYSYVVDGCIEDNSLLTGPTSKSELKIMEKLIIFMRQYVPVYNFTTRVNGKRIAACQATPTTAKCKSKEGFTFTDPLANSLDFFTWATSSGARVKSSDDCIVLVLEGNKPIVADVQSCEADSTIGAYLMFCAKKAWV